MISDVADTPLVTSKEVELDGAIVAPIGAPRVLDTPETLITFHSVAHNCYSVINV